MTRGVWAALVVCAAGSGCMGPQYYTPAPEQLPQPANVNGTMVQITDQRPEWEKKPFTGKVCLYDLGKSHPNAWAQLSEEVNAIIAELPQKPERAEVVVTSFRIVRNPEARQGYRDLSAGPNPNPEVSKHPALARRVADDEKRQRNAQERSSGDPGSGFDMLFASADDPRRMLQNHPAGASCALQATIRLVFPGGQEQSMDVKAMTRGANESGTSYWGDALEFATRSAVQQFGRQVRTSAGLTGAE